MSEDGPSLHQQMRNVLVTMTTDGFYDECMPCGSDRLPYPVLLPSVEEPSADLLYLLLSKLRSDFQNRFERFTSAQ